MRWKGRQRPPRKYLACTQQRVLGVRVRWAFRLKDVLFTGSLKEYCPQRIRQLISVGYANIPMSADWGINQRLFHLVVPASPTLLGAGFFCVFFFPFFVAVIIPAFMITSHLAFLNMFAHGRTLFYGWIRWLGALPGIMTTFFVFTRLAGYPSASPRLSFFFYAAVKNRSLRRVDRWFILSTRPRTHT